MVSNVQKLYIPYHKKTAARVLSIHHAHGPCNLILLYHFVGMIAMRILNGKHQIEKKPQVISYDIGKKHHIIFLYNPPSPQYNKSIFMIGGLYFEGYDPDQALPHRGSA